MPAEEKSRNRFSQQKHNSPQRAEMFSVIVICSGFTDSVQFFLAPNHNKGHLRQLILYGKDPTVIQRKHNQTTPTSRHTGDSGEEKLVFNRNTCSPEPGSGRGGNLTAEGLRGRRQDQRHTVRTARD